MAALGRRELWKLFIFISLVTFITTTDAQTSPQPTNAPICTFLLMFIVLQSNAVMLEEDWIVGNPSFPRVFSAAAIGFWNNSIFILGGYAAADAQSTGLKQFVEYNLVNSSIMDHGANYFSQSIFGIGQFYHQQHNYLYMIDPFSQTLCMLDLSATTKELQSNWNSVTIPHNVNAYGCLVGNDEYLFIVGGDSTVGYGDYVDYLQILQLSPLQWLSNTPSLNSGRRSAACIIHESSGFLYAIGGFGGPGLIKEIEKVNIANILSNSWQITSELIYSADGARAILYDSDYILVFGGWRAFSPHVANEYIQIIDTKTDTVSLSSSTLHFPVETATVIKIENKMYKFGGSTDAWVYTNQWETYHINTDSPTQPPSTYPTTGLPSLSPSQSPSNLPSSAPIAAPTIYPTSAPSSVPIQPSSSPVFPTFKPSQSPSKFPAYSPSFSPSSSTTISEERNTNKITPINDDVDSNGLLIIVVCVVVGLILMIICLLIIIFKQRAVLHDKSSSNVKPKQNPLDVTQAPFATNKVQLTTVNSMSNNNAFVVQQNVDNQQRRNDGEGAMMGSLTVEGNDDGMAIQKDDGSDKDDEILEAMNQTMGANIAIDEFVISNDLEEEDAQYTTHEGGATTSA
eukprot:259795_1